MLQALEKKDSTDSRETFNKNKTQSIKHSRFIRSFNKFENVMQNL